jgi:hypothetical protein
MQVIFYSHSRGYSKEDRVNFFEQWDPRSASSLRRFMIADIPTDVHLRRTQDCGCLESCQNCSIELVLNVACCDSHATGISSIHLEVAARGGLGGGRDCHAFGEFWLSP